MAKQNKSTKEVEKVVSNEVVKPEVKKETEDKESKPLSSRFISTTVLLPNGKERNLNRSEISLIEAVLAKGGKITLRKDGDEIVYEAI